MIKTKEKYADGSYKYIHKCIECEEGTYIATKNKTDKRCAECNSKRRAEIQKLTALKKRNHKLLNKVYNTKLALEGLSQEALREILEYHSEGVFTWKDTFGPKMQKGTIAGSYNSDGYKQISFNNTKYLAHRLTWIYHYGDIPKNLYVDHKDRDTTNNRAENLRLITPEGNAENSYAKGYVYTKGKYMARLVVKGKVRHIGTFSTAKEAQDAYFKEKAKFHID